MNFSNYQCLGLPERVSPFHFRHSIFFLSRKVFLITFRPRVLILKVSEHWECNSSVCPTPVVPHTAHTQIASLPSHTQRFTMTRARKVGISRAKFDRLRRLTEKRRDARLYISSEAIRLLHARFAKRYHFTEDLARAVIQYIREYRGRCLLGAHVIDEFGARFRDGVTIAGDHLPGQPAVVDLTGTEEDELPTTASASGPSYDYRRILGRRYENGQLLVLLEWVLTWESIDLIDDATTRAIIKATTPVGI